MAWTIGTSPNAELANRMLRDACATLGDGERPVIHSDRGCHYRWPGWISICRENGLTRSMSAKGCSPDNAAAEGFFGRLKQEFFHGRSFTGVTIEGFVEQLDGYMRWYRDERDQARLRHQHRQTKTRARTHGIIKEQGTPESNKTSPPPMDYHSLDKRQGVLPRPSFTGVTIEGFVEQLDGYRRWYRDERIKLAFGTSNRQNEDASSDSWHNQRTRTPESNKTSPPPRQRARPLLRKTSGTTGRRSETCMAKA